ncbi:unnamed protein product [Fraxinus pennsylvanica]|uniref:Helicase C-terminal domain-containing protein n=1 Tax=Fraxinus pennsylvanica TaxID=56036 RepID=A0AAD2DZV2_9LAMI|nr:unnamed protein product [Fraxinus pennsylvanica]
MMKENDKQGRLKKLLDELGDKTAIVFVNTKKVADNVAKNLDKEGYRVTTMHGEKSQKQRKMSLEGFRTRRFNVLVATDVAGRGKTGVATTFLTLHDTDLELTSVEFIGTCSSPNLCTLAFS